MVSGVYKIHCASNDKVYIGSAIDIKRRWRKHKSSLANNCHANKHLQNAWNKYGEYSFEFTILEETTDKDALLNIEQVYINNSSNELFNIRKIAESNLGLRHTSETKSKMSKKRKDWIEKNPEFISDLKNNMKGNTNGFKKGERSAFKGKKHSDETKEKLRNKRVTKNILQYNKEGILIKKWSDMNEIIAAGFHRSCVLRVCVGDRKTHAGYIWKLEKQNK